LDAERPAVIAADGLAYAAIIAARASKLPCATVCAGLKLAGSSSLATGYRFELSPLDEPRRAAFARHGIAARFHMLECLSDELDIVFTTRDLVGDAIAPGVLLAGPSRTRGPRGDEPAFPWQRLDAARPLVALAFGSVHTHELLTDVIEPFVRAARRRGAQAVVASEAHARAGSELAGAVVVPYAPQRALLERAVAFVTHGGAGSVIEALDAGVPPIVVPLSGDQGLQARLVDARGAGVWIERAELDAARAEQTLDRVMRPHGPLVAGARRIREAWRDLDGALAAARAIVALA
jgi:UDP:flavonoid glycosyltransferase YjiC (YdhE family)